MANQPKQQQHFSRKITTTNRQSVKDQGPAASFNHPVQMATANPFATNLMASFCRQSVKDQGPAASFNHPVQMATANPFATNLMASTGHGPAHSSLPDARRKRPPVSSANEVGDERFDFFRVPGYAPQNIVDDIILLRENHNILSEQSKMIRMQFADMQNQAVQHLVEKVRTHQRCRTMRKLNAELTKDAENLRRAYESSIEYEISCEIQAMTLLKELEVSLAEVSKLQGLVPPDGAVEQDVKSNSASTVSRNNTQRNTQGCVRVKVEDAVGEIAVDAEKVQTGATPVERGKGSGEK